jgi:hypothetical protein
MAQSFIVTATLLNVRSTPAIMPGNIVGKLGEGQRVSAEPTTSAAWLQVQANNVSGFASSAFLRLDGGAAPIMVPRAPAPAGGALPPAVHFPANSRSALNSTLARHTPLFGFSPRPRLQGQAADVRKQTLHQIVVDLDVTRSVRYTPNTQTYCNIYAYDFCFLAGVYLPRVWWNSKALIAAVAGGQPEIIYDQTVREMTANALHRWLGEWGDDYGWQPCASMEEVQQRANTGDVGLITAERMDPARSGHIVVVMPENEERRADRLPTGIVAPLQSQAGRVNKSYFSKVWWDNAVQYRASGFWAHA